MKKITTILFAGLLVHIQLYGHENNCEDNHLIFIGVNYTRAHVTPDINPFFEGNMGGMQFMYQYKPLDFLYAGVGTFWRYGSRCICDTKRALLDVDVHERIGYTITAACCRALFTPYTGFGFRYLSQRSDPNEGVFLKLNYNEFYIPVGLLTEYEFSNCFSMGLQAIWMPQVFSTVAINLAKGAHFDVKRTIKNIRISVPFIWDIGRCRNISIMLKPYYEKWENGRTIAITFNGETLAIPKNSYNFWGVDINLLYRF